MPCTTSQASQHSSPSHTVPMMWQDKHRMTIHCVIYLSHSPTLCRLCPLRPSTCWSSPAVDSVLDVNCHQSFQDCVLLEPRKVTHGRRLVARFNFLVSSSRHTVLRLPFTQKRGIDALASHCGLFSCPDNTTQWVVAACLSACTSSDFPLAKCFFMSPDTIPKHFCHVRREFEKIVVL
ncbi:hypothetical protein BD410DRAFT_275953 [Rickenella mellea]|uniref:Uncharacterized protein n=1 Tax=Rickenella mellea TaxID=50990 RepID=A0A4Y7Q3H6_9AGAM|nr:hypothetical protein BD410DRAFT_275953 [Rickenella mellea]